MNVLVVTTEYPPLIGGIAGYAEGLVEGLVRAGARVRVITSVPDDGDDDRQVVRIPSWLNRRFIKTLPLFLATVIASMRDRPDRVVALAWTHEGVVARAVRALLRIRYVLVVHGSELVAGQKSRSRRYVMRRVLNGATAVIANSTFTKQLVSGLGAESPVEVVHPPLLVVDNPTPPSELDRRFQMEGKRVILTAGRLFRRKGHDEVIQALARLRSEHPDLIYVVVGEGPRRDAIEECAAKLGVSDVVRLVGFVSREDLWGLYHRAELYASLAQDREGDVEGFGIALIEAAACGTAVVAERRGGVPDAVQDGGTGLLVDLSEPDALEHALRKILDDDDFRHRLAAAGRVWAAVTFDVAATGRRLLRVVGCEAG